MLPCGRPRSSKNTTSSFVDVAVRVASILTNHDFLYLLNFRHIVKRLNLGVFVHEEYARNLSYEKW